MTEEQRQLLVKDLCGRLPYGVNVLHVKDGIIGVLSNINIYVEGREQKLKCSMLQILLKVLNSIQIL